jgi:hypothetical protein
LVTMGRCGQGQGAVEVGRESSHAQDYMPLRSGARGGR